MIDYPLQKGLIKADVPVEVGHDTGHFWFPSLHRVGEETLVCAVIRSDDVAQGKWPADLFISQDAGSSWRPDQSIDSYGHTSIRCDESSTLMMPYELWPLAPGDNKNCAAPGNMLTITSDGSLGVEVRDVQFCDFPAPLTGYHGDELFLHHTGNLLRLPRGSLLTMLYGRFEGSEDLNTFAVGSDDGGFTWRYRGTVAGGSAALGAPEGPNEADVQLMDNGDLLCVYRVSDSWDFHKSYSQDEGRTWSQPQRMEGMWSVQPRLARLGNGAVVLTGGRPGLFAFLCADGKGEEWEKVNLAMHHNQLIEPEEQRFSDAFCKAEKKEDPAISSSYTAVMLLGDDGLIVTYDRLGNGWSGAPGPHGEVDRVVSVVLKVSV